MSSTTSNTKPSLKSVTPEIKNYIAYLESENIKLHKQVAQLQVKHFSSKNRVSALEEEVKKFHFPKDLSEDEIDTEIKKLFEELAEGYGYAKIIA